jgi:hypothetical protein
MITEIQSKASFHTIDKLCAAILPGIPHKITNAHATTFATLQESSPRIAIPA